MSAAHTYLQMRARLVPFLLLLALPATAAARTAPPKPADGTLSIREGRGVVQLNERGSVTGRLERGKVTITDPNPYDKNRPVVYGAAKTIYRSVKTTVYQGKNLRFRLSGGPFTMRIDGRGIFFSAVGRGRGQIDGAGDVPAGLFYDGVWSLNDEAYHSLPDTLTAFQLAGPPATR
jgi:hypothetical protein